MAAIIADFGLNDEGLQMYRLNGSEAEINDALEEIKNLGCEIHDEPLQLEKSHKHYSVFVKIQMPSSEKGKKKV